ncbi:phosphatidylglycerol lysyltransferase domain-containing protein [uncultured Jatrophihabitans sp.]|uniref:phosphatidylglycerol lysyltransferase domain-containing protein n=1 Tax=uncultured Jatrophihabitans sp. TaxID=1610747 RepID=UPI0035CC0103
MLAPSYPRLSGVRRRLAALDARAPQLSAWVAVVAGLLSLSDVLWPHRWRVVSAFSPIQLDPGDRTLEVAVAVAGLLLLRVATGLRRGKRSALLLATGACVAICLVDIVRDDWRPIESTVVTVLLVGLVLSRKRFQAVDDPVGRGFALRVAAQFVAAGVLLGVVLLYLPGHVPAGTPFLDRLVETVRSLVGLGGHIAVRGDDFADAFHAALLGFGLLAVVSGVVLYLAPFHPAAGLAEQDEQRLRSLLDRHGATDSLGYFALRRDKSVVWSPSGKAAITYRVVAGVALASGDPIGDVEAWPGAIAAYRDLVQRHGWTPAVMGCSERGAVVWSREYGLAALSLGDEAVLDVATFSLDGRPMRGVRQACARVERAGYRVKVTRAAEADPAAFERLRTAADAWRCDAVERGFSMALSRLGDVSDPDCVVVTAEQDGELRGLLHFVPWGPTGISLDLMRRARDCDNGINEFMIVAALGACPELGVQRVSLNFAVFREALERGSRIGAGPILRAWRAVLLVASRWWQIESLYRFNDKFQPTWLPRFVCYPGARDLPRIAIAGLEAQAFLVRPRLLRLARRG